MAFFKSLIENIGQISKKISVPGTPVSNNEVGLTGLNYSTQQDPNDREAIYPNWFFSARLGQPRGVDTRKLRKLATSPWAQMVITTFKKQITTIPWEIVAEDEDDETDHKADIKLCNDFLKKPNQSDQTINDVNSEVITDIAEIDAGCLNYVYSNDSWVVGEVPVHNAWGKEISFETDLVLRPLGQRTLVKLKSTDGATMLKQVDIYKNLLNYWQYSFKHPRQNPTRFTTEEISYIMMNPRSYDVYGFSPMQSIQQVIELLIQGTRYNKDLYYNNAIPDILVSLPKVSKPDLRKLKRSWNNQYKGKPHQVGFINWVIDKIEKLNDNNRDLEWLDGQKWYFKLVFGAYGVSPDEAGFFENSNKSNDEGQEKVTVRNALKPYMQKIEQLHTSKTITEILGREDHGLKWKFFPKDHAIEKVEFEQNMQELDRGIITVNEYRKSKGKEEVEWGDEPLRKPFDPADLGGGMPFGNQPQPNQDPKKEEEQKQKFRKSFEGFLNDRK